MKEREENIQQKFDVVVIGGGPAGMSAAVWCSKLGLGVLIVERSREFGGQLHSIHNPITDHIGLNAANGGEMNDAFQRTLSESGAVSRMAIDAAEIDRERRTIRFANGEWTAFRALIFAGGVRRRTLGVEGEDLKGIMASGAGEKKTVAGQTVMIVGGGDAALENATILGEYADRIYVVHRRPEFSARPDLIEAARRDAKVEFIVPVVVRKFGGREGSIESAEIEHIATGETRILPIDRVLVRIGVEPNTELLRGVVEMDAEGYVKIDANCRTNVPSIFAAGDAAFPVSPTISTAVGSGAASAKNAYNWLTERERSPLLSPKI